MGKNSIFTPIQKRFLEAVIKEPYIVKKYYFTGGTALSEFYLQHRLSKDIDLFSEKEVHLPSIAKFIKKTAPKLLATEIRQEQYLGLYTFFFAIPGQEDFKVDFNYYPFLRIEKGKTWRGLAIDSLLDIAVNKIHTLYMKPRAREYVDLYFILKEAKYSLKDLIQFSKIKFDWHTEPLQLARRFLEVISFKDYPQMLTSFNQKEMQKFFLREAKKLEKEIFKK
jgi:predicted nucleotidyltransferase component of viral defense system